MCHPKVELDFLSLKINVVICSVRLKKMFHDQLFMLEPVPSVVSYSSLYRRYLKVACSVY